MAYLFYVHDKYNNCIFFQVLIQQQQTKINELVSKAQVETIQSLANDNHINLTELDNILQPIIDTCTKDSISSGVLLFQVHNELKLNSNKIRFYLLSILHCKMSIVFPNCEFLAVKVIKYKL